MVRQLGANVANTGAVHGLRPAGPPARKHALALTRKHALAAPARSISREQSEESCGGFDDADAPPADAHTRLHVGAQMGHREWCASALAEGAGVNEPGSSGWTALFAAASLGHEDVVKLLAGQ